VSARPHWWGREGNREPGTGDRVFHSSHHAAHGDASGMKNRSPPRSSLELPTGACPSACDGGTAVSRGARGGRGGAQVLEAGSHPERAFLRVTSLVGARRKEGTRDRVQKPS